MLEDLRFKLAGSFDCRDRRAPLGCSHRPPETVADAGWLPHRGSLSFHDEQSGVPGKGAIPPWGPIPPVRAVVASTGGFRCRGSILGASFDEGVPLVGSATDAVPAPVVRVSERHQRSSIPWSRLGHNPGTTSRRSIRPRERQRLSIIAWSRLQSSGCGVNRTPTQDGERRKMNLRPRARSGTAIASTHVFRLVGQGERRALDVKFGEAGNPRVRGYAAVLGGWQMPATQRPPTVRQSALCASTGSLAPKVALAE